MKRPALIVFDLDGTLVDSRTDLADAANAALHSLGLPTLSRETIISYVGDGIEALLRRCLTPEHEELLPEAKANFFDFYRDHLLSHTVLLPDVRETLQALKGECTLAVLTNKSEPFAKKILEGLGVAPLFSQIVGERDGQVPKPGPAALRDIMGRERVSSEETLMVGDGKNDILVAKAAGCRSCLVADTKEKEEIVKPYGPDFVIHRMSELLPLIGER